MSNYVDERVVEMRFDNKKFESNVSTSMKTIDKLKANLDFRDAGKSFETLTESAKHVDFSSIENSVDALIKKFSILDAFHLNMVQTWGKRMYDFAERQVKSLSTDNIVAGWNKYESKASSVQTIMNSTGLSIEKVNGYLDKLMWYSDETSYSFADMTSALSTMLAAGGDINKLIPMIEGMANATSYAGKGSAEFNRVLYNLNQSYSQGFLNLMDWKSVQLAGVNSKALIQTLIDTGEALGKIRKGQVTTANFTSSLAKKWADTEVMEQAFAKFAEATEEAYRMVERGEVATASEAYERLSKSMEGIGITAAKSAQEAKTFGEAIASVKDAVATKFMTIFDYVFGDYAQAKVTWTKLANDLWEIFAGPFDDVIELSGFDQLVSGAKAVGIDIDKLKKKMLELAVATGVLTKEQAESADVFGDMADKSWITRELYSEAIDSLAGTTRKSVEELKKTWTEWQNLMYMDWVVKAGKELQDLEQWQLNSLGITREQAAEYGNASQAFLDYAASIRDADGETQELIDHINDPGIHKLGITEIFRQAFKASGIDDLNSSLDEAGFALTDFESQLEEVGIASGKVTKEMIEESGGLVESFASGWLDKDIYLNALDKYAEEQSKAAQDIEAGLTSDQKYWFDQLVRKQGKTLDTMAQWELNAIGANGQDLLAYNNRLQQVRDYIDLVKEGTVITDEMFNGLTERSGQSAIAQTISNLSEALMKLKELGGGIMESLFPASDQEKIAFIRSIVFGIESLTQKLILSDETIKIITDSVANFADIFRLVWKTLKPIRKMMWTLSTKLLKLAVSHLKSIMEFTNSVAREILNWLGSEDRLLKITENIVQFFKGLYVLSERIFKRMNLGTINFETLRSAAVSLYDIFKKKLGALVNLVDPDGHLQKILDHIVEKFNAIKQLIIDIKNQDFDSIDEFIDALFQNNEDPDETVFSKILRWAMSAKDGIVSIFESIKSFIPTIISWIKNAVSDIWKNVGTFLDENGVDQIVGLFTYLREQLTLENIIYVIKNFNKLFMALITFRILLTAVKDIATGVPKVLNRVAKGIQAVGRGLEFTALAFLILSIGKTFELLQQFDFEKDWDALLVVILMMGAVVGIVYLIAKFNKALSSTEGSNNDKNGMKNILGSIAVVAGVALAVLAMAAALKLIMDAVDSNPEKLWPALQMVLTVVAIVAAAITAIGLGFKNVDTKGLAATLLMIPVFLAGILYMMRKFGDFILEIGAAILDKQWGVVLSHIGGVITAVILVGALFVAIHYTLKNLESGDPGKNVAPLLLGVAALMLVVTHVIKVITKVLEDNWVAALGAAVIVAAMIGGLLFAITKLQGEGTVAIKAAGTLMALSIFLGTLGTIMAVLSIIDSGKLAGLFTGIVIVIAAIGGVLYAASLIKDDNGISAIKWVLSTITVVVASILAMSLLLDSGIEALEYAGAVAGSILALAAVLKIVSKISEDINKKNIIAVVAVFASIAGILGTLDFFVKDAKKFAKVATVLSVALIVFAGAMYAMSKVTGTINWKNILMSVLVMASVAATLTIMAQQLQNVKSIDTDQIKELAIAIGILLGAMAILAGVAAAFGGYGLGALALAIAAVAASAASMAVTAWAFGQFTNAAIDFVNTIPVLADNIVYLSAALEQCDWSAFGEFIKMAASGAFPLIGVGIGLAIVGAAANGLAVKLMALALGIDAVRMAFGQTRNIDQEAIEQMVNGYKTLIVGLGMGLGDTDISAPKEGPDLGETYTEYVEEQRTKSISSIRNAAANDDTPDKVAAAFAEATEERNRRLALKTAQTLNADIPETRSNLVKAAAPDEPVINEEAAMAIVEQALTHQTPLNAVKGWAKKAAKDAIGNVLADVLPSANEITEMMGIQTDGFNIGEMINGDLVGGLLGGLMNGTGEGYNIDGIMQFLNNTGGDSAFAFANAFQSPASTEAFTQAGASMGSALSEPLAEAFSSEKMFELGSNAVTHFGQGVTSKESIARNAANRIKNSVVNAMSAYSEMYSVGSNISQGLIDGMRGNDVVSVAGQIANSMVAEFRAKLKINSPSKEGVETGGYYMQGITVGILDEATNTFHAIDEVAETMLSNMASAVQLAYDIISNDVDTQPVIKPLMDLTEIEDGARRINTMVSTQNAMRVQSGRENTVAKDLDAAVQNGNKIFNYTQNNYSPRALSRIEIYRQTKNQLDTVKG